jgi:hypothetical protein
MNDTARLLELRDRLPAEWAGLLTQAARALAEMQTAPPDDRHCHNCGSPLPPQDRGRPRKWCQARDCQRESKRGGKKREKGR